MHKFDPKHIERLLRAERYTDIVPDKLLCSSGLKEGDRCADVGCGPGFFTIPASGIVGKSGRVYAIDTQEEMLTALRKRGLPRNVEPVKSGEKKIPLPAGCADFALLAYVFHETADKAGFLKEVRRIIRAGGVLLLIDWKKKKEEHGPPFGERLSKATTLGFIEKAGFAVIKKTDLNSSHYRFLAVK